MVGPGRRDSATIPENLLATRTLGSFFALVLLSASPKRIVIGAIAGTTTTLLIAFSGPMNGFKVAPLAFKGSFLLL